MNVPFIHASPAMSHAGSSSFYIEQIGAIIVGFVLTLMGILILAQYEALRRGRDPLKRVSQFAMLGMIASFAGAVGNFIQTVANTSLGAIIGTLASGALVGFLGVGVDTLLETLTSMPPTRLVWVGRIVFILGIVVEISQGSILFFALQLP